MEPSGANHEGGHTIIQLELFGARQEAVALTGPNLYNGVEFGTLPPLPQDGMVPMAGWPYKL